MCSVWLLRFGPRALELPNDRVWLKLLFVTVVCHSAMATVYLLDGAGTLLYRPLHPRWNADANRWWRLAHARQTEHITNYAVQALYIYGLAGRKGQRVLFHTSEPPPSSDTWQEDAPADRMRSLAVHGAGMYGCTSDRNGSHVCLFDDTTNTWQAFSRGQA